MLLIGRRTKCSPPQSNYIIKKTIFDIFAIFYTFFRRVFNFIQFLHIFSNNFHFFQKKNSKKLKKNFKKNSKKNFKKNFQKKIFKKNFQKKFFKRWKNWKKNFRRFGKFLEKMFGCWVNPTYLVQGCDRDHHARRSLDLNLRSNKRRNRNSD